MSNWTKFSEIVTKTLLKCHHGAWHLTSLSLMSSAGGKAISKCNLRVGAGGGSRWWNVYLYSTLQCTQNWNFLIVGRR